MSCECDLSATSVIFSETLPFPSLTDVRVWIVGVRVGGLLAALIIARLVRFCARFPVPRPLFLIGSKHWMGKIPFVSLSGSLSFTIAVNMLSVFCCSAIVISISPPGFTELFQLSFSCGLIKALTVRR